MQSQPVGITRTNQKKPQSLGLKAGDVSNKELMFVVYDPTAGFVTGGGRIVSVTDPSLPGYGRKNLWLCLQVSKRNHYS